MTLTDRAINHLSDWYEHKYSKQMEVMPIDSTSLYPVIYLIGFAALHSFLASLPAKRIAKAHFGSKVDSWYPVFFSAVAAITILPLAVILFFFEGIFGCSTSFPDPCSALQRAQLGRICPGNSRDILLDSRSISSLWLSAHMAHPLHD